MSCKPRVTKVLSSIFCGPSNARLRQLSRLVSILGLPLTCFSRSMIEINSERERFFLNSDAAKPSYLGITATTARLPSLGRKEPSQDLPNEFMEKIS
jgi:hypothetical protein